MLPDLARQSLRLHRFALSGHCHRVELLGASLSLADIACYTYTAHAPEGGVQLDEYPALRAWLARVEALPRFVPMRASPRPEA